MNKKHCRILWYRSSMVGEATQAQAMLEVLISDPTTQIGSASGKPGPVLAPATFSATKGGKVKSSCQT